MKQGMFIAFAVTLSITANLSADLIVEYAPPIDTSETTTTLVPVTSSGFTRVSSIPNEDSVTIDRLAAGQRAAYASTDFAVTSDDQSFMEYITNISKGPDEIAMMFELRDDQGNPEGVLAGQSMTPQVLPSPTLNTEITANQAAELAPTNLSPRDLTNLLSNAIAAIPETGSLAVMGVISMGLMLRRQRR